MISNEWGSAIDVDKVDSVLAAHPNAKALAFVHAETSTGARSDAQTLSRLAHEHDCLSIVDSVTGLGGIELRVDDWGIDAIYSGTQKCLSCVPGLSPVSFSNRAAEIIRNRSQRVQSWFLDLNLVMAYWGSGEKRSYHHTAPVNSLYGLHEALVMLKEEGLEKSWDRHRRNHLAFAAGIEAMGLRFFVDPEYRLPQLNTVTVPESVDEAAVRSRLLTDYGLEIGAGLGSLAGKVWRIGLMGFASSQKNVLLCLTALDEVLSDLGANIDRGAAVTAAQLQFRES